MGGSQNVQSMETGEKRKYFSDHRVLKKYHYGAKHPNSLYLMIKMTAKLPTLSSFSGGYAQTKLLRVNTDLS